MVDSAFNTYATNFKAKRKRYENQLNSAEQKQYFHSEYSKYKSLYSKTILSARRTAWREACTTAIDPFGHLYKSIFKPCSFPSQIFATTNSSAGTPSEHASSILQELYPSDFTSTLSSADTESYFSKLLMPDDVPFSQQEIDAIVHHLNPRKAPGVDGIDNNIIKRIHTAVPSFYLTWFHACDRLHVFPSSFKIGNIILFQKNGKDLSQLSSYRPISLLSSTGKLLERLMLYRFNFHLQSTNYLHHHQYGFRPGCSVTKAISNLLQTIEMEKTLSKHVGAISIDIQSAFDTIRFSSIRNSLCNAPCPANIAKLFFHFLQDRQVTMASATGVVQHHQQIGCVQGSCSGPTLWNLVADELLKFQWPPHVHVQAYADDIIIVLGSSSRDNMSTLATTCLALLNNWLTSHQLRISLAKTSFILFTKMKSRPKIHWNGISIRRVQIIKYLGLHIDSKFNWIFHIQSMASKAMSLSKKLQCLSGRAWGFSQQLRRHLYKTVAERSFAHGCAIWCLDPTPRMFRTLESMQRRFLLSITGAFSTTATSSLQIITGLPPLAFSLQAEARFISILHLRNQLHLDGTAILPGDYVVKLSGWITHPATLPHSSQISITETLNPTSDISIYSDGSKFQGKVGAAFVVYQGDQEIYNWQCSLSQHNSVFQAELYAILQALEYAQINFPSSSVTIYSDSMSGILAVSDHLSPIEHARKTSSVLASHSSYSLFWIKGHSSNIGNDRADQLAKNATLSNNHHPLPLPWSHLKNILTSLLLKTWQSRWSSIDTGRPIFDLIPTVSLKSHQWFREEIIFFTGHGPFPSYLHRFHLRATKYCDCGQEGTPLHYLTECLFTVSFHMATPSSQNLLLWKLQILKHHGTRRRLRRIIQFLLQHSQFFIPQQ